MSMFNDISCGTKDNEEECLAHAKVVSTFAKKFGTGQRSFIGPSSEKQWYSMEENSPQGIWDHIVEKMLWNSLKVGVQFSVQRLHSRTGRPTLLPTKKQLRLFFA